MKKKYLLFDLDGTLFDTSEGIIKSILYTLGQMGIEETNRNNLLRFIGPPLVAAFEEFYGFSHEKALAAKEVFRERYASLGVFECAPVEGSRECLQALQKDGRTLCVATCKPEHFANMILEKFGFSDFFQVVVGSEMDERRTRKDEVIEEVFARLDKGDVRGESLMIGDREHDIFGAKKCGVESVGMRLGFAREGELEEAGADHIVSDFKALRALLLTL